MKYALRLDSGFGDYVNARNGCCLPNGMNTVRRILEEQSVNDPRTKNSEGLLKRFYNYLAN